MKLRGRWNHLASEIMSPLGYKGPYAFNDGDIVRYLLGDMPDEQAFQLEELYFCDPRFFAHVKVVESKLINSIPSRGERDKALFEKKYLTMPALRAKVDAASRKRDLTFRHSTWRISLPQMLKKRAYVILVLAGVLLVAIIIPYWSGQRRQAAVLPRVAKTKGTRAESVSSNGVVALTLSPGLFKGGPAEPSVLTLSDSTKEVSLTVVLPALHDSAPLDAELLRAEATKRVNVFTRRDIRPMLSDSRWIAHLNLQPGALGRGDYLLYLKQIARRNVSVPIETYAFSVERK